MRAGFEPALSFVHGTRALRVGGVFYESPAAGTGAATGAAAAGVVGI